MADAADTGSEFTGTQAVAERHRFDERRLADYLAGKLPALSSKARGPLAVEQFKGGQSNPTYRLRAGDHRL